MTDERGHEVASFHLARFPIHAAPGELGAMWFGRGALAAVEGLRWWKPLILGLGPPRRPHHYPLPSLRRGALLARWEDERALDEFLAGSEVAERWRRRSRELWHVCLEPVTSRGGWQGLSPPFPVARPHPLPDGPAVLLTYGRLWARAVVPFFRALSSVHADLRTRDRLLAYTGSVEAGARS